MDKFSILITGVGAVIGQGIIKSLRRENLSFNLVGIDNNPFSVGFQWADKSYDVPLVSDSLWSDSIIRICNKENVILVLPGIEQDVKGLLENKETFTKETKAFLLLNSSKALNVGFDKWQLYLFAKENNIRMPLTWLMPNFDFNLNKNFSSPILLKPRKGMASKGIYKIEIKEDFNYWYRHINPDDYIVQEYIGNDEEEYTISIFGFNDGTISVPFALKRKLNYGSTFEAETIFDINLLKIVTKIAKLLNIIGPTNFQFRKKEHEYFLIEINPRFSSSTSIMSAFGFNQPLMAVKNFILNQTEQLNLKNGRCSRYIEDNIIFTE